MGKYILGRLLRGVLVLLGVSVIVFLLVHLSGNPLALLLPLDAPPEQVAELERSLGLDRPLPVQYLLFLGRVTRGDLGYSYHYRSDALTLVLRRVPTTLRLTGAALMVTLTLALPAGILAAVKRGTLIDALVRLFVLLGQAVPGFWLALMMIVVFAVRLRWLPVSGSYGWQSLVLPAITAGSFSVATVTRVLRSSLLGVLGQSYVQAARAKGLPERLVVLRHALKNAAIPVVTVIGVQIGWLLGGSVIAEVIFAYPGIGRLAMTAIGYRDLPVIQSFVLVMALVVVAINLLLDIVYSWLDPRIRLA